MKLGRTIKTRLWVLRNWWKPICHYFVVYVWSRWERWRWNGFSIRWTYAHTRRGTHQQIRGFRTIKKLGGWKRSRARFMGRKIGKKRNFELLTSAEMDRLFQLVFRPDSHVYVHQWLFRFVEFVFRFHCVDPNWRCVLIRLVPFSSTASTRTERSTKTRCTARARCWVAKSTPPIFGCGTHLVPDLPGHPSRKNFGAKTEVLPSYRIPPPAGKYRGPLWIPERILAWTTPSSIMKTSSGANSEKATPNWMSTHSTDMCGT